MKFLTKMTGCFVEGEGAERESLKYVKYLGNTVFTSALRQQELAIRRHPPCRFISFPP
jgi:hypothetical protein